MTIKLYMENAHYRLDWQYIKKCFTNLGFADKWINWIMEYISTMTFFVLANGIPGKSSRQKRGNIQ